MNPDWQQPTAPPSDPNRTPQPYPPQSAPQPPSPYETSQQPSAPGWPTSPTPQMIPPYQPAPLPPTSPQGITSLEYLNAIAPKQKTKRVSHRLKVAIISGTVLLVFAVGGIIALTQGGDTTTNSVMAQKVVARSTATAEVTKKVAKRIKNGRLAATNSTLSTMLPSFSTKLTEAFAKAGINTQKIPKDIAAAESNDELLTKLTDAHLQGTFDIVYAREMAHQLTTIMIDLHTLHQRSSNQELRDELTTAYASLEPLQKSLDEFSVSSP